MKKQERTYEKQPNFQEFFIAHASLPAQISSISQSMFREKLKTKNNSRNVAILLNLIILSCRQID